MDREGVAIIIAALSLQTAAVPVRDPPSIVAHRAMPTKARRRDVAAHGPLTTVGLGHAQIG